MEDFTIDGLDERTASTYLRRHPLDRCGDHRSTVEIVETIIRTGTPALGREVAIDPIGELAASTETARTLANTAMVDLTVTAGIVRKPYFVQ